MEDNKGPIGQRPKLRQAEKRVAQDGETASFFLSVSGVVVHKNALVAALKPFLPQLADIQPFEDGERLLFVFNLPEASQA